MENASPHNGPVAAVFDLTQPASCDALADVVGIENLPRVIQKNKPLLVLVLQSPGGESAHLSFEDEAGLLHFYLSTLRMNAKREKADRLQFVLRDIRPALEQRLREVTRDLALEVAAAEGSA